jgi:uncharacterized protein (TIGR03437 family)
MTSEQTGLSYTYYKHQAVITGLEPGTEYSYRVILEGAVFEPDNNLTFRTAGASACSFLAIGDTGTGSYEQGLLAQRMQTEQAALVIHTGDIAYPTGQYEAYENRYFDYYHAIMRQVPFFPCPGNHDYYETRAYPYISVHDLPAEGVAQRDQGRYYSFDWGDVHFIALDSNDPLTEAVAGRGEMLRWLERDLAETKKFWRIAFFHHPPYAFGPNSGDGESARIRSHVVPMLQRYGVPLVLSGHEHSYQRTRQINRAVYVTTGGGGAHLYPVHESSLLAAGTSRHHYLRVSVEGRRLNLRAIDANGEQFDEVTINPAPVLANQPVVSAGSFDQQTGEGALISIFGWQMAVETLENGGKPLPENGRSGVQVTAGDQELVLLMVSPTQVNAVLPEGLTGSVTLRVSTPGGTATTSIEIARLAPALFPAVVNPTGSINTPEAPCPSGSSLTVYATGLARSGEIVTVRVGGQTVAGRLSRTSWPGLQSVSFALPSMLAGGRYWVDVEAGGVVSNSIPISIRD